MRSMGELAESDLSGERLTATERTFETFFRQEYARLSRALFLITGDAFEAEEIAQAAMVRVLERWDRVSALGSPTGYLYRTALNLQKNALRRLAVRRRRTPPAATDPVSQTAADDRDELDRLLASLPRGQRSALVLVEWFGMSSEEAGAVLGIRGAAVRVRISRAKASLRKASERSQHPGEDDRT
jgi:RNA polymerase sigma factor (sigma-70 family)